MPTGVRAPTGSSAIPGATTRPAWRATTGGSRTPAADGGGSRWAASAHRPPGAWRFRAGTPRAGTAAVLAPAPAGRPRVRRRRVRRPVRGAGRDERVRGEELGPRLPGAVVVGAGGRVREP